MNLIYFIFIVSIAFFSHLLTMDYSDKIHYRKCMTILNNDVVCSGIPLAKIDDDPKIMWEMKKTKDGVYR